MTVLLVLAAGIGLSYVAATAVLQAFSQRPQKAKAAFTTAEAGSGD